ATRAGYRALALLAYENAAVHFKQALEVWDLARLSGATQGAADPGRRCELFNALAEAQMAVGDVAEARGSYERAATYARSMGLAEPLAQAALGLGVEYTVGVVDAVEIRLLEEALGALANADSLLCARVLARLARALLFTHFEERRAALSEQAVAMARRLGDAPTLAAVLCDRHNAIWGLEDPARRLAIATEVFR